MIFLRIASLALFVLTLALANYATWHGTDGEFQIAVVVAMIGAGAAFVCFNKAAG